MVDITNGAFRLVCKGGGADVVFAEMMVAEAVLRAFERMRPRLTIMEGERPVVFQITGKDIDNIKLAVIRLYEEFIPNGFDINMACPAKTALKGGYGARLLEDAEKAAEIVRVVKEAVSVPVSVKMRRVSADGADDTIQFARKMAEAGADLITVHGRTRSQHYETPADWGLTSAVAQAVDVPVLGTGDMTSPEKIAEFLRSYPAVAGALVARGAIGNSWIFEKTKRLLETGEEPEFLSWEERVPMIKRHAELMRELFGERSIMPFRKHLSKYVADIPNVKPLRDKLVRMESYDQLYEVLANSMTSAYLLTRG